MRSLLRILAFLMLACAAAKIAECWALWRPLPQSILAGNAVLAGIALFAAWRLSRLLPRALDLAEAGVVGAKALAREVSDRRRMEAQLRALNATLEARVGEGVAEAQHQRDELARSNADLEQFAYVASHDLKAPLRAISNLAHWLAEDLDAHLREQDRENLGLMLQRIARMTRMLDDLLAYSRVGRVADAGEPMLLAEVLQESWDSLGPPKGFTLERGPLPPLRVDGAPFRLLLLNLLSNAVKHHDKGAGHIRVSAAVLGPRLSLKVEDDGPGIGASDRERVFQMFQTLRPRDEVEGTGLGLALVKRLTERRGGRVWIEDAQPRGCRVCLEWPLDGDDE